MSEQREQGNFNIAKEIGEIKGMIQGIANNNTKIMIALIGVIAAQVGLKFVGSPITTVIASAASFFSSAVLLSSMVIFWRKMSWSLRLVRLVFAIFIIFSVICRNVIFQSGQTLAPGWYSPTVDGFFIILCLLLIWRALNSN